MNDKTGQTFSPVLISVYDRLTHFKRCIESLQKCTNAEHTVVYIAIDYPKVPQTLDTHQKIVDYAKNITGFENVVLFIRAKNLGSVNNFMIAREDIFKIYNTLIFTEDDNEFSPNFLDYINKGLLRYRDDPRVIAICGDGGIFAKPVGYDANYSIRKGFSAWGYGTWKGRLNKVEYSVNELLTIFSDKLFQRNLRYYYETCYYSALTHILKGQAVLGDLALALEMVRNDTYCVYPTMSLVRNYGHDGSGEHGGQLLESPFSRVEIDCAEHFDFIGDPVFNDPRYVALVRDYCKVTWRRKVKFWLKTARRPFKMLYLLKLVMGLGRTVITCVRV